jgi:trk system potassium uptake protein TrkA
MRVIICGAGQVGFSIASYLSRENNNVTVIDCDADMIARVNMELDANGILGSASSPEILHMAGANDADMIVAVTHQDEVNMVACQVAHSLFNVPKKIARLRQPVYRDPAWSNLFSRAHMPIDVIITPEVEVARAVEMRLSVPGTTSVTPMGNGNVYLCGVICEDDCPLVNTQLKQLTELFPDMRANIVSIVREGRAFIPDGHDQMLIGDEVMFIAEKSKVARILSGFGHEEKKANNVVIVGGGNIGLSLVKTLQESDPEVNIKIIETNPERAHQLSEDLEDVLILNASGLDRRVLEEANIAETDTMIAVTEDDETNLLSCLLARQYGCARVIPLVNKDCYNVLIGSLGLGAVVSPKAITASTIMRHVRRGRIKAVHNLLNDFAEVLEIEASDTLNIINVALRDLGLPHGIMVCAILRGDDVIIPGEDDIIKPEDRVIILATQGRAALVEKLFSAPVDIF